jgi:F-type H+-transporting ATPase subunit epsilon
MYTNMPKTFRLSIFTPDKVFFDDEITQVAVTTPEGEMGIMADYMPSIAVVSEGILKVEKSGVWHSAAVSQGFMEVSAAGIELFVDSAEWAEDIDVLRSETALHRAEERLRSNLSHTEYLRTHAAVARATARLKAAQIK